MGRLMCACQSEGVAQAASFPLLFLAKDEHTQASVSRTTEEVVVVVVVVVVVSIGINRNQ
jgi:hypothetical protein